MQTGHGLKTWADSSHARAIAQLPFFGGWNPRFNETIPAPTPLANKLVAGSRVRIIRQDHICDDALEILDYSDRRILRR